ncbi:MbtH family NRPS accessory protein [Streptomyces marianii]|uniref:MbtH family protein n=1 Tax=Streptomyces marianii TaxID=1817406 RepID=A0A5R9EEP2_9ACTN|nr:MbtH family NRPS accessory protein [Streptomyces marianii]TLQ47182.1 MbtH family protein [Streptomyces marianii]
MTGNPFDTDDGGWQVVTNDQGHHALWRPFLELPAGWNLVFSGTGREDALHYIERNWTVLGPVGS